MVDMDPGGMFRIAPKRLFIMFAPDPARLVTEWDPSGMLAFSGPLVEAFLLLFQAKVTFDVIFNSCKKVRSILCLKPRPDTV